jgi:hypothetical protein
MYARLQLTCCAACCAALCLAAPHVPCCCTVECQGRQVVAQGGGKLHCSLQQMGIHQGNTVVGVKPSCQHQKQTIAVIAAQAAGVRALAVSHCGVMLSIAWQHSSRQARNTARQVVDDAGRSYHCSLQQERQNQSNMAATHPAPGSRVCCSPCPASD